MRRPRARGQFDCACASSLRCCVKQEPGDQRTRTFPITTSKTRPCRCRKSIVTAARLPSRLRHVKSGTLSSAHPGALSRVIQEDARGKNGRRLCPVEKTTDIIATIDYERPL